MPFLRRSRTTTAPHDARAFGDVHEWILSLPWVVERPYCLAADSRSVRSFGVECPPLGLRQLWLLTGFFDGVGRIGSGVAVVLPESAAEELEAAGQGIVIAPMPAGNALVAICAVEAEERSSLEAIVLMAYGYAMS